MICRESLRGEAARGPRKRNFNSSIMMPKLPQSRTIDECTQGLFQHRATDNEECPFCEPTSSDASVSLSKSEFLNWVEKGLKIDLSAADVTLEDLGKALGVWSGEEHERLQQLQWERAERERQQEVDINQSRGNVEDIYTREES